MCSCCSRRARFCLAIAVTAGSRPFLAAAVTAAGLGWPATILPARNTIAMGALGLLAALWPIVIAALRDRRGLVPGAAMLAGVVVVAAACSRAPARGPRSPRSTGRTGTSSASPAPGTRSRSSGAPTTAASTSRREDDGAQDQGAAAGAVLAGDDPRHSSPSDHWVETLYATGRRRRGAALPADPLLPAGRATRRLGEAGGRRARARRRPRHRRRPADADRGRARTRRDPLPQRRRDARPGGLGEMRRYTVWSYAPRPTPAALVRSPPAYPARARTAISTSGRTVVRASAPRAAPRCRRPLPGRALPAAVALPADVARGPAPDRARPARRTRRRSRSSAGSARPAASATTSTRRTPAGLPPLVDFLERSKLGYCQQFAGTMALMLRYLGIPARVAVGFTSGTWKDGDVDGDRPRRARVGGGVVRGLRLAHVRPDARARHALGDVHERVGLGRRNPGARHRPVPRRRASGRRRHRRKPVAPLEQPTAAGSPVAAARSRSPLSPPRCSPSRSSRASRRYRRADDRATPGAARRRPARSWRRSSATRAPT